MKNRKKEDRNRKPEYTPIAPKGAVNPGGLAGGKRSGNPKDERAADTIRPEAGKKSMTSSKNSKNK